MAKVTSKLQVTVPKAIADAYGIKPGDEIVWIGGGESIHVRPASAARPAVDVETRLALFREATKRQRARNKGTEPAARTRGWTREDLYDRGGSR
jgi:AbrB family looped-hinge helix DNA binding protein